MTRVETIGNATLYLGDCLEVLPRLTNIECVITDPPYGVGLVSKSSDYRDSNYFDDGASLRASVLYRDDREHVKQLVSEVMPLILSISERAVVFCGPAMLWSYPEPASIGSVFTVAGAGRSAWGFQCTHPVLFYGKDPFLQDGKGSRPNSLRDDQPNRDKVDHPCPKPLSWMNWAIGRATRDLETVCDPFMGSGTTGISAVTNNRKFIGIEIEPKYFDIACERIENAQRQQTLFEGDAAAAITRDNDC
jgi:site-specific DNA-methyltransferase (adenine-specific)